MGSFRSWRTVLIAFAVILAITVAIGGCFGGGDSLGAVLKVCVTEIDTENLDRFGADLTASAPGVEGAHVTLVGTSQVATTNGRGEFTFRNVSPGTYNVAASKTGWASAAAYNIRVDCNRTNEVTLRMVKPGGKVPVREATPPEVSVSCYPSPVQGKGYISVEATASNNVGIRGVLLFIDNSYAWLFEPTSQGLPSLSETYEWNTLSPTSAGHNGEHNIAAMP